MQVQVQVLVTQVLVLVLQVTIAQMQVTQVGVPVPRVCVVGSFARFRDRIRVAGAGR